MKPKTLPTTEERATITTMTANGTSISEISRHIGRSRHLVRNVLAEPKIQRAVIDEKAELAELYRQKARDVVKSIDAKDISKASLQQKAVSSGILLDKSLLLAGEPTGINVVALLDVVDAIKARRR